MTNRIPENIDVSPLCPNCHKRVFVESEPRTSNKRYSPPKWFRKLFVQTLGVFPLGYYRLHRCEVCGKTMAVFDENKRFMQHDVISLYACSLLSVPVSRDICDQQTSCYGCPGKKEDEYVKRL